MRLLITSLIFASGLAEAIEACQEHDYCPPQGVVQVMVAPKISEEHRRLCDGAIFTVRFSLKLGKPTNVVVESGPDPLKPAIAHSFELWRFGSPRDIEGAVETVSLTSACSIQEKNYPW